MRPTNNSSLCPTNDLSGEKFSQLRGPSAIARLFGASGRSPQSWPDRRVERPIDARSVDSDDVHEKVENAMLNGLMMDDFQLSLTVLVERAERLNSG